MKKLKHKVTRGFLVRGNNTGYLKLIIESYPCRGTSCDISMTSNCKNLKYDTEIVEDFTKEDKISRGRIGQKCCSECSSYFTNE